MSDLFGNHIVGFHTRRLKQQWSFSLLRDKWPHIEYLPFKAFDQMFLICISLSEELFLYLVFLKCLSTNTCTHFKFLILFGLISWMDLQPLICCRHIHCIPMMQPNFLQCSLMQHYMRPEKMKCGDWSKTNNLHMRKKMQISFAVTAKLISAFVFVVTAKLTSALVFATGIVQLLYFLIVKFPSSSHLVCLYSSVCVAN